MSGHTKSGWHSLRDYTAHWVIGGVIIASTGAAPEHWLAQALESLRIPESVLHLWSTGIDVRVVPVAIGMTVIAVGVLRRSQSAQFGQTRPVRANSPSRTMRLPKPGSMERDGIDFPEMILVPGGHYIRGVPEEESKREGVDDADARPLRNVTIAPFWLSRHQVTRGQFAAFIEDTGRVMPERAWTFEPDSTGQWKHSQRPGLSWINPGYEQSDEHPAVCVSYDDAIAYAEWLCRKTSRPYRLPSEAEWEYAARAGTTSARFWGESVSEACRFANVADRCRKASIQQEVDGSRFFDCEDGFPFTSPVGTFEPNPFGLHDMLGNVWEWTADSWHRTYEGAPDDGRPWIGDPRDATTKVIRGGSFNCNARFIRAGVRNGLPANCHDVRVGFRVARSIE
jgi:formylglycine-generating enzyme